MFQNVVGDVFAVDVMLVTVKIAATADSKVMLFAKRKEVFAVFGILKGVPTFNAVKFVFQGIKDFICGFPVLPGVGKVGFATACVDVVDGFLRRGHKVLVTYAENTFSVVKSVAVKVIKSATGVVVHKTFVNG